MIQFFQGAIEANDFMEQHKDDLWAVSISSGHISGSVFVLFSPRPAVYDQTLRTPLVTEGATADATPASGVCPVNQARVPLYLSSGPKRRGRPPKVKDASNQ